MSRGELRAFYGQRAAECHRALPIDAPVEQAVAVAQVQQHVAALGRRTRGGDGGAHGGIDIGRVAACHSLGIGAQFGTRPRRAERPNVGRQLASSLRRRGRRPRRVTGRGLASC